MSQLLGAWLLSPPERVGVQVLPERQRLKMLAQLGETPVTQLHRRRLWLAAGENKLHQRQTGVLAYEGFVAATGNELEATLARPPDAALRSLEGHCVATFASDDGCSLYRSLSGGEYLYFVQLGGTVLFSSSIRPLLAHPAIERQLSVGALNEALLSGHVAFGPQTLVADIQQVLPGHRLHLTSGVSAQRLLHATALRSAAGPHARLAVEFREQLNLAVERAVGPRRPVALALSGGIDSSAIAASLVEVVGAGNVHALSYEFDDPGHSKETHFARAVSRRLGIAKHDVFQLSFKQFIDDVPEHVWRSESAVHWPKAFLLQVARHIRGLGYDRYLTGFGIGSHMAYLDELARVLPRLPLAPYLLRYWKKTRFDGWRLLDELGRIHPSLEPPHNRLYDSLLQWLQEAELIHDRRAYYPDDLALLLTQRGAPSALDPELASLPLRERLQRSAFNHLISCVDITRSEKASRELGIYRVAPAHFANTIPYAYFPPKPTPRLWTQARLLRPGKHLLRLAYRGTLPDEVLFRKKSWDDAVASDRWRKRARVMMLRSMPQFPGSSKAIHPDYPTALTAWEPWSIQGAAISTWFWKQLFIDRPPQAQAPSWQDLLPAHDRADLADAAE